MPNALGSEPYSGQLVAMETFVGDEVQSLGAHQRIGDAIGPFGDTVEIASGWKCGHEDNTSNGFTGITWSLGAWTFGVCSPGAHHLENKCTNYRGVYGSALRVHAH